MIRNADANSENDTIELLIDNSQSNLKNAETISSAVKVDVGGLSHQGLVRANNEDHYLAVRVSRALETCLTNLTDASLCSSFNEVAYGMLVADGIGGTAGGEIASSGAILKVLELALQTPDWVMRLDKQKDSATVMNRITERFRAVDAALRQQAERERVLLGMGTTLTTAISHGLDLFIGHIGDSRAYLFRGNRVHQLTQDNTLAQALVDAGIAKPADRATHAMRHVLTAALGSTGDQCDPQVRRLRLVDGDQVLLCTDGLTEMVSDDVIASVLHEADSAQEACQTLVDLALAGGGTDNVTVVLAKYSYPE